MVNDMTYKFLAHVKVYVRENWGSPFIVGFMMFMVIAAAFLLMNLSVLADEMATLAYFALVAGVIGQFFCYLKSNKRNSEKDNGSN
jgi:ABC-type enterobactin transport system permease subunit